MRNPQHNHETFAKRSLLPPATAGCQAQILILKILNVWMPVPMNYLIGVVENFSSRPMAS